MRYSSIDILRTIALFVMVLVHFAENLAGVLLPIAGFGAPLFAFLSGVSYRLWANGQEARGKSELQISKVSIRRGLFVFGVGFAFNILIWLPEDAFNWDVLTFIGVALVLLNFARKLPLSISVLAAVLAVLMAPVLRTMADYPSYWLNRYYDPDPTLSDMLIGFFSVGYFPLFPWIAFSLSGFVTASLLFGSATESDGADTPALASATKSEPTPLPSVWPIVLLGISLIGLSITAFLSRSSLPAVLSQKMLGGWTMFPPTMEYVLGTLGMALLLFSLGHQFIDRNPRTLKYQSTLNIAKTFSRYSFTIYVLHHVIHLWPLWIYGLAQGQEPTYYWMQAMTLSIAIPLALLFMVCCYFLLRWLGPDRNYGIESAMRWLCD